MAGDFEVRSALSCQHCPCPYNDSTLHDVSDDKQCFYWLLVDRRKQRSPPPPAVTSMLLSLIFSSSLFLIPFEPKFACETCWGGGVTTPHAIANFLVTFPLYMEVLDQ